MDLTFTRTRFGALEAAAPDGTRLFTIDESTTRGDQNMHMKTSLPGLRTHYVVEAPDNADEVTAKAMHVAAKRLERWAAKTLGVTLIVNVVDNT